MFTVPAASNLREHISWLSAKPKTQKLSTQMKNHSHASPRFHRSTNRRHATSAEWKTPLLLRAQHNRLSRYGD
ncbi:hypothetical protein TNCV_3833701 [Trichonephila clavipes]|nr:hypothetical protein TNCV_3833701 [Trichonephila clavipes]